MHDPVNRMDPTGKSFLVEQLVSVSIQNILISSPNAPASSFQSLISPGAWVHKKTKWAYQDISDFRNYIQSNGPNYEGARIDCADLAITMLIDFASNRGLPVILRGYYYERLDSRREGTRNMGIFLHKAKSSLSASEIYDLNTTHWGALSDPATQLVAGDLLMKRGDPSLLGDILGFIGEMGHTRIFLGSSSQNNISYIAGDPEHAVKIVSGSREEVSKGTPSVRWWNSVVFNY